MKINDSGHTFCRLTLRFRFQQEVTQPAEEKNFPEPRNTGFQHQAESEASKNNLVHGYED